MHPTHPSNPADVADRHAAMLGIAAVLVALKFAASASLHLTEGALATFLDRAELVLALAAAALALWILGWKTLRMTPPERRAYFGRDGFAFEALRQARIDSWNVTFVLLVVVEILAGGADGLPAEFFVQLALAILLAVFGVRFSWILRAGGNDDA